ncbi:MAG: 50S ribosomal protein L2 [Candidatus Roizmanbacteria bacterium GW2011_GWC2_37_13]|uniref:Large ribosomal subunit protein uL2 n=1 Tax=Candidatus Roizmanbacteria bacterium GW2011_GWC2_37_13 TaxID=1618486 RepID=A0A0G0GKH3_9BACT|nr:MAG: 50S ribosomal protein L2, large subunit ribosomal protein L2 [Candidatus Roizmanbacteria bacterium GW2011_GWC1_37_12]KKQ26640.1 MAG: 50S ribosomal protein L2 [Candidatus Roizmanbacteria bacterium GW2011_GWC2_37_13]
MKNRPEKSLIKILKKHSGRDNTGSVSVRHQGGRQKRYYRQIDFKRDKKDVEGEVVKIEKDPNRNALIALIKYKDNELRYIIQPVGLKEGDKVIASVKADIKTGNAIPLKNVPIGVSVHNVEIYPGQGGQMVRSAGTTAVVVAKEDKYTQLKLQSGEIRRFFNDCWATIGQVGNIEHKDEVIGRAGRKILMGIRPTVRGTAQNPRSHPHGGGEGRSGEGMHPKTPWGKPARGKRTRNKKSWNSHLVIKRRK